MYNKEGDRILLLDLLKILHKHSDENHRITQDEIIKILEKEYNAFPDRKTVKTNMKKLVKYGDQDDANEILSNPITRKTSSMDSKKIKVSEGYTDFGFIHDFTHGELRLIIDGILFSKQIPSNQREELIKKLEGLTSKHFNSRISHIRAMVDKGPKNNRLFFNIEILDEAINKSRQVSFNYNKYSLDEKSKLVLNPQLNLDGTEKKYIINPYQIAATNGRYYLICNNDIYDNVSHYRLDRMSNIKILNENQKSMKKVKGLEDGLNLPQHMAEHIYMYTGKSDAVFLRFKKSLLNEFVDWFGTDNIWFSDQTEDELTVRVIVNRIAMRKWALQYALHVRVLSPKSLVDEIKNDINKARENYM